MKKLKLVIELMPQSVSGANIRKKTNSRTWEIIKRKAFRDADNKCQVCGATHDQNPLECHEQYEYDDSQKTMVLKNFLCLCSECHRAQHADLARSNGRQDMVIDQLIKVNEMMEEEALEYIEQAINKMNNRSKKRWRLDTSFKDEYIKSGKMYDYTFGGMQMDRKSIYEAFDEERNYQDSNRGKEISVFPQIAIDIEEHLNRLKKYLYNLDDENAKNEMRKIGTLCVKYAEEHGMPTRREEEGDNSNYNKPTKSFFGSWDKQ